MGCKNVYLSYVGVIEIRMSKGLLVILKPFMHRVLFLRLRVPAYDNLSAFLCPIPLW
jgi:hypothetical protein